MAKFDSKETGASRKARKYSKLVMLRRLRGTGLMQDQELADHDGRLSRQTSGETERGLSLE